MILPAVRGDVVADFCRALGVDPHHVARMDLTPARVTGTRYCIDAQGHRYADERGDVATVTTVFPVDYGVPEDA